MADPRSPCRHASGARAPSPAGEKSAGSDPPDGCDGGTPIGPENRRFSWGRSRFLVRRNVRPRRRCQVRSGPIHTRSGSSRRCDRGCDPSCNPTAGLRSQASVAQCIGLDGVDGDLQTVLDAGLACFAPCGQRAHDAGPRHRLASSCAAFRSGPSGDAGWPSSVLRGQDREPARHIPAPSSSQEGLHRPASRPRNGRVVVRYPVTGGCVSARGSGLWRWEDRGRGERKTEAQRDGCARARAKLNGGATAGFEAELWAMADTLHGLMDAAEYKRVVLGLIFLKYISHAFEECRAAPTAEWSEDAAEDRDEYIAENIFWVRPRGPPGASQGAGKAADGRPERQSSDGGDRAGQPYAQGHAAADRSQSRCP